MRLRMFLLFFALFVLFVMRSMSFMDPDFGFHIREGNYILKNGIPHTDPYSYSMPSYPFVDHEWLTNIVWAEIYNKWGSFPLVLLMSALAVGSLVVLYIASEKKWTFLLLAIGGATLFDFVGVRTQVITWFLLSVLLCILFKKKLWRKFRFALPVLFLLWANLHGGFGIGLGVLGIVLVGRMIEEKKQIKETLLILILCTGITLVNPNGIRLWWEFFQQLTDTQLRWYITEWHPAYYFTNFASWGYIILSVIFVLRYYKKFSRTELFLYFFLLYEGMASMRNIPIWILASFFITLKAISYFYREAAKQKDGVRRFRIAYQVYTTILLVIFLAQSGAFFYGIYVSKEVPIRYPVKAVVYLHNHMPHRNIFSSYDWGDYLMWQLPEKKDFIDGRMPSWRWNANIPGQSNYAFDEYKKVVSGEISFRTFAAKYHISTLLVSKESIAKPPEKFLGFSIRKSWILQKLFYSLESMYEVFKQAKQSGWKEVYSDNVSVVYQKPGNP